MKYSDFAMLDSKQQRTLLLSMAIRNELEDFHAEGNLSDAQMKILNQAIRKAIYSFETTAAAKDASTEAEIKYLISMIPEYWEIPE